MNIRNTLGGNRQGYGFLLSTVVNHAPYLDVVHAASQAQLVGQRMQRRHGTCGKRLATANARVDLRLEWGENGIEK